MDKITKEIETILSKYLSDIPMAQHKANKFINELSGLIQQNNWISVEDELPENAIGLIHSDDLLLFTNDGCFKIGYYGNKCGWVLNTPLKQATHWQPLPKPPKE